MIEVSITVEVDGITYGSSKTESSVPGRNSTKLALALFDKEVETIRRIMSANIPTENITIRDDRPATEVRIVSSGAINVKPTISGY